MRIAAARAIARIGGPIPERSESTGATGGGKSPASTHGLKDSGILQELASRGYTTTVSGNGQIWVIGGDSLRPVLEPLGFRFVPNGTDVSHGKPAWSLVTDGSRTTALNMPAGRRTHGDGYPD